MRTFCILSLVLLLVGLINSAQAADYNSCILEAALKVEMKKNDNAVAIASAIVNLCEPSIEADNFVTNTLASAGADVRPVERSILQSLLRQETRTKGFNAAVAVLAYNQLTK